MAEGGDSVDTGRLTFVVKKDAPFSRFVSAKSVNNIFVWTVKTSIWKRGQHGRMK